MMNNGDVRVQYGYNAEEILRRARRGEIIPYMLKLTGVRQVQEAWRESIHAKLWDNLTVQQQQSWNEIVRGFDSITGIMQAKAMDYASTKGQGIGSDDNGAAIQADYRAWADRCRHRKLKFDMIVNIIAGGMSEREAARTARPPTSRHYAHLGLIAALDVYSELKGWR